MRRENHEGAPGARDDEPAPEVPLIPPIHPGITNSFGYASSKARAKSPAIPSTRPLGMATQTSIPSHPQAPEDPRTQGTEVPRSRGTEVPRNRGPEVPRPRGPEEPRNRGTESPRTRVPEDPSPRGPEAGFTLVTVMVLVMILSIFVAYTVPKQWSIIMQRDREIQTIWVMKQYARGIQNFQRVHSALPVSLEQLEKQTEPRVMRRMYENPLSGEMDWILIPPTAAPQPGGQAPPGTPQAEDSNRDHDDKKDDKKGSRDRGRQTGRPVAPGPGQPFIGVRPPQTGESIIALNGATSYENWSFTIMDLQQGQPGGQNQQNPGNPQRPPSNPQVPQPGNN